VFTRSGQGQRHQQRQQLWLVADLGERDHGGGNEQGLHSARQRVFGDMRAGNAAERGGTGNARRLSACRDRDGGAAADSVI
jgi:hypothetical protein